MVLVSWMIFSRIFNPKQITGFMDGLKNKSNNREEYRKSVITNILWFTILVIFLFVNIAPAVLIAYTCNSANIIHIILSVLFSDVYILHYAINKFLLNKNYCNI